MGQLGLLLWKNWLLQKRRICISIFEVLLPVFFAALILLIRSIVNLKDYPDPTPYHTVSVALSGREFQSETEIGYVPPSTETDKLMSSVLALIENRTQQANLTTFSTKSFDSEDAAIDYYRLNSDKMRHLIIFDGVTNTSSDLPQDVTFTIRPYTGDSRWRTEFTYPVFQTGTPRDGNDLYKSRGVLYLQALVGEALTRYWLDKGGQDPDQVNFGVYTNRMAYPPYFEDPMIQVIQSNLPLFLVLSFILSVIVNTKNLVYEKERKLKESMKLMGMTPVAHWFSWFITFTVYLVPALAVYAILCGVEIISDKGAVLANSDASLFFVFLLCYGLAMISFCFMVSTFAQKANVGAGISGVLFFGFFFPYYFIQPNYEDLGKNPKLAGGLLFNTAMSLGANCIGIYEGTGEGAQWSNFHKPGTVDDNLSLLECMLMLLVDSLIHFIIAWYLDNVRPGEFGVPKPFYFCCTKSYWCGGKKASDGVYESDLGANNRHFEKEPTGKEAGIQICNLKKKFGKKVAVAGTSLNMYEGQISVLLGHNGAGKTTTMSMLTGFIPPTSGTALVNGCDIRDNISGVRSSLGLCPQHNILFDTLTVREHLEFFAKLKGMTGGSTQITSEVLTMAKEVGLETKINTQSQHLSGGQKRKLSVGIALIAGSKVVILDEPTSGMDPAARRQTWNVLQNARQGRTLVLSTHYMDEADLLGDRIAIMAEGVIKCCGSSMFLKKLYGAGYHLVVVKRPECNVDKLTSFVQSHISSSELETIINTEVTYLLPDNESAKFANLFREMENNKDLLCINSFGTSATTMEEVFLKVGDSAFDEDDVDPGNIRKSNHMDNANAFSNPSFNIESESNGTYGALANNKVDVVKENSENENRDIMELRRRRQDTQHNSVEAFNRGFAKNTGFLLQMSRMKALFVKKAIHTWRNRTVTLVQLLLPVIFTILGLAVDEARPVSSTEPALTFDLNPFGRSYIPYSAGFNPTAEDVNFRNAYAQQFDASQTLKLFTPTSPTDYFDNFTVAEAEKLGLSTFNKKMVIGFDIKAPQNSENQSAIAYYNGQPFHAQPVAVNYLMNSFMQYTLNDSFSLQSRINPLPKDDDDKAEFDILVALGAGFSIGFFISFGMSFLTTLFIYFLIKERQVGAKHMQVVSGVGPVTYWLPTFLWDFINYIIPSLLLLVVFAAYNKVAYLDDGRWALTILVLVIYGWAVLPFMYAFQFAFTAPPTGVVTVIMLNIVTGLVTTVAVFVLQIPGLGTQDIAEALDWVFKIIFPNYNMASCFINIYTNYLSVKACQPVQPYCVLAPNPCCKDNCGPSAFCAKWETNYLSMETPGIGTYMFLMFIQGLLFFIIVMLIEYHFFQRIWYLIRGAPDTGSEPMRFESAAGHVEDSDVAAERQRVNSNPAAVLSSTDSLILANLYKRYGYFVAVDHICVGVPDQECFGLLGQNGAGKTTTFKMLTGDVMVTGGNAYLKGYDVRSDIKHVQANMGYCPQFDALIDQMTGRETLTMYARLRGVPENHLSVVVNSLIDILMLRPHADKLSGQYSGGNKRKLSTAMALVGDPPFIMLDEPSSGMDPKARRQLWNVLSQVRASGRTLVLTSHSMEECDALCTRIAIMVNGRFMCLGSPQHLKNKFGEGYTLIVQLGALPDGNTAPNQPVIEFISQHFPGAKVFDDHQGYIHFQVPDATVKLADVFSLMETTKQNLNVEDYSVHQTTLEQVFLTFTRSQITPKETAAKGCLDKFCCCGRSSSSH